VRNGTIYSQLLLITNRKSHTGFRSIPISMILNDLERRNSPYFAFFFTESIALLANYVTVVEDVRKILAPSSSLPFFAITHSAVSAIADKAEVLVKDTYTICPML